MADFFEKYVSINSILLKMQTLAPKKGIMKARLERLM